MATVILVTPDLHIPGGVTAFNQMLLDYGSIAIKPFVLSGAGRHQNKLIKKTAFLYDVIRFTVLVSLTSAEIIHLNTSLAENAIKRDGILCRIAKFFKKKVYIHWHGWNPDNEYLLEGKSLNFLKHTIFKADHIKFLSSAFARLFVEKGYTNKTSLGNTFIDDALLNGIKPSSKDNKTINILFLSTISKNKGIYMAIELFSALVKQHNITLTIAGSGPELENIMQSVKDQFSDKISFTGHITGQEKINSYRQADIYLFPSHYEGMPISVLEAMGFGLPVICSAVGALPDFFISGTMGYMIERSDRQGFLDALKHLVTHKAVRESMGNYNHHYATEHFLASRSVDKIEKDYRELLS